MKPGDAGFVYDKVVDFSKQNNDYDMADDSWGEDEDGGDGGDDKLNVEEYYDEEDEDERRAEAILE